jgi:hypothetical protein
MKLAPEFATNWESAGKIGPVSGGADEDSAALAEMVLLRRLERGRTDYESCVEMNRIKDLGSSL